MARHGLAKDLNETMRFIDDRFPLLLVVQNERFDHQEMLALTAGYEGYFRRNERYAVLTVAPGKAVRAGAKERKVIADWMTSARVKDAYERLCVGAATVVPSAMARGAMTAFMWIWTAPSHFILVSSVDDGLDHCFERLALAKVPLPTSPEVIRAEVKERLRALGGFEASLGT